MPFGGIFAEEDILGGKVENISIVGKLGGKGKKVEIKYRDVHSRTLTNDVQYFPPKERVY